jgi:hypothetical protein
MLTAAFRAFGGEELVKDFLTGLPGGFWTQFVIVMGVIFVLGFFLDFIEIAVVVVPIVAPILLLDPSANITAVWLGVMIGLNIQTSFLTPPFGFALFYLRGVAPAVVKTISMYKGVVAFITLQLIALGIVGMNPWLVNYLPTRLSYTADTAPPPLNPRLQYCMEQYVFEQFNENGDAIRSTIADARKLNVSYLPKKMKAKITESFDDADATFDALKATFAAEAEMNKAAENYAPLHHQVRKAQFDVRELEDLVKGLETDLRRTGDRPKDDAARQRIQAKIAAAKQEMAELNATIPADWEEKHKAFAEVQTAYKKARGIYRRHADGAFEPILEMNRLLAGAAALEALREPISGLKPLMASADPKDFVAKVSAVSKLVKKVDGTSRIRSQLSKASKAMKAKKKSPEKATKALDKAMKLFEEDVAWRSRAAKELRPGMDAYNTGIRNTIGLRQLSRLPEEQSLYAARCNSGHRDISLNF